MTESGFPEFPSGCAEVANVGGIVDHAGEFFRARVQRHDALDRGAGDHRGGDVQAADDPMVGEDFGFADLGAADTDGAGLDLALGDIRALVRLGVRAQLQTSGPREICHAGDVAGEGVEIDHQRRGVQAMPRSLLVQQMAVKLLVVHSAASSGREAPWAADGVSGPAALTRRVKNSRRLIRPLLTTWHAPAKRTRSRLGLRMAEANAPLRPAKDRFTSHSVGHATPQRRR